jgi:hypothetical protein
MPAGLGTFGSKADLNAIQEAPKWFHLLKKPGKKTKMG